MSDLTQMTDKEIVQLMLDTHNARKLAIRTVLKYRARMREIKREMKKRVTETNKEVII